MCAWWWCVLSVGALVPGLNVHAQVDEQVFDHKVYKDAEEPWEGDVLAEIDAAGFREQYDALPDDFKEFLLDKLEPKHKGPDLAAIWDEHTKYEFQTRDLEDTLNTMVDHAYVNHIPTMTGGVGKSFLKDFYGEMFIPKMPKDTGLKPLTRTVQHYKNGGRVVDEMLFSFTHDMLMDWILPGVPPTHKYVEVPLVVICDIRGDKLYYEHIYWDQASVLVQIGLLNPDEFEPPLPVTGHDQSLKVDDPSSVPSNTLIRKGHEYLRKINFDGQSASGKTDL